MLKPKQPSHLELYHQRKLKDERERAAFLPPGFINHGNTCFMNSVLQGLVATRLLHDLATFAPTSTDPQRYLPTSLNPARSPQLTNGHGRAGKHEQPSIDGMPIADRFVSTMHRAWDAQSDKNRESISPKLILNALGRKYPQYLDFAQQDAHEFLRILLDAMRMEEIDVIKKRQPQPENRKPRKRKHISGAKRKRSYTPASPADTSPDTLLPLTDMVFGGQLTSILICQKCKHISQTYEDFYDISLSIKPEDYASPSTAPPPSLSSTALFSIGRSLSVAKEKAKGEAREKEKEKGKGKEGGHEEHGRERRRDKLKKFMKGITTSALNPANPVEDVPRASSVPPDDSSGEKKPADVRSRKDALRKRRSRSLDHLHKVINLQTVRDTSEEREGVEDERGSGEGSSGRDEAIARAPSTSDTVESDWSVVKEDMEVSEETLPASDEKKKKKDKEDDGWVKLGKRLSMLTRHPKDKEPHSRERIFEEIRARRKSRESSPDRGSAVVGRSILRRDLVGTPPLLPTKTQPSSTPANLSPPAIHHQPSTSPKLSFLSPLSQPAYNASPLKVVHCILQSTTTLTGVPLSDLNQDGDKPSGLPGVPQNYKHEPHMHSPTPAEAAYMKRILADIDVSKSESSSTPSGGWSPGAPAPPSGLVNPFTLLMKSSAAKKGSDGVESGTKADAAVAGGGAAGEARPPRKWSSWLGMNRLSGVEECLRLFTSVEVLDNEDMVGCRRCWKMANREKERETARENGDEHEDGTDDDEESSSEEDEPSFPKSPALAIPLEGSQASDTPGGVPILTISTTGPESPLEPPVRPRIQHPVRSNSADFVSLSAISSREETPILASTLLRNVSSPSIPSTFVSPHSSPHSRSSFPPYTLSNHLYSHPLPQVLGGDSLVIPRAPLARRRPTGVDSTDGESDESTSAVDSRSGGEDGDDRASIGSSTSLSPPRSGARSLSDSGYGKVEEESPQPGPDITVSGGHTNDEATTETEKNEEGKEEAKIPKKPKPVIMRPAYKRYLIAAPPPVLVIHLKRFQQTDKTPLISFTPTYGFKKLDDYVTFPEYLDLTPFLAPKREDYAVDEEEGIINGGGVKRELGEEHGKCMYRLYAVVVHIGNMLGGHYIAYTAIPDHPATSASSGTDEEAAKPKPPSANSVSSATLVAPSISSSKSSNGSRPERQWAYVSDVNVRLATLEEVLKAKAYICMYERICS